MPLIWCSISGHGFGHASQVIPVLTELGILVPRLTVVLRTMVPARIFQQRLRVPFEIEAVEQDIGCIQDGPIHIEVEKTWQAYREFHRHWEQRLADETEAIRRRAPCLVLSDISYLAIEAGAEAGATTVALSSLSWDVVLEGLRGSQEADAALIRHIAAAYGRANVMLRIAPGLAMPAFGRAVDVSPVMDDVTPNRPALREMTGTHEDETLVVMGFGGIALTSVPWQHMEHLDGYRFVVPGSVPSGARRIVSADELPCSFRTIMASADVLMTKPGYASIVEAVAMGTPVIYVRRYNFADESTLVTYLHRYGRGLELSLEHFSHGQWRDALAGSITLPPPPAPPPAPTGHREAARILAKYLQGRD
jgi:hypothetical protein